jgi:hypothetical protein
MAFSGHGPDSKGCAHTINRKRLSRLGLPENGTDNRKTLYDAIQYDSVAEANFAKILDPGGRPREDPMAPEDSGAAETFVEEILSGSHRRGPLLRMRPRRIVKIARSFTKTRAPLVDSPPRGASDRARQNVQPSRRGPLVDHQRR